MARQVRPGRARRDAMMARHGENFPRVEAETRNARMPRAVYERDSKSVGQARAKVVKHTSRFLLTLQIGELGPDPNIWQNESKS